MLLLVSLQCLYSSVWRPAGAFGALEEVDIEGPAEQTEAGEDSKQGGKHEPAYALVAPPAAGEGVVPGAPL